MTSSPTNKPDTSTTSSRPFFKNKYVEYRRMYDEARSFSKTLDNAQTSNIPSPPTKSDMASDLPAKTASHSPTKHLARRSGDSPFGVHPKDMSADSSAGNIDSSATEFAANANANVSVPNTGAASDRMVDKLREFESYIRAAADRYGLPPELIAGVIWQESRGNPRAVSHCGAMGLMQLMPATAASLGAGNAFDVAQNIDAGSKYLRQLLDKFNGRVDFAVAAYNSGPGNVAKFGGIPPFRETQDYVPNVLGFANSFKVAQAFATAIPSNAVRV